MTLKDERRAAGIVRSLTEQSEFRCSDCGEMVDVSDATTNGQVVERLGEHREVCEGEWFSDE